MTNINHTEVIQLISDIKESFTKAEDAINRAMTNGTDMRQRLEINKNTKIDNIKNNYSSKRENLKIAYDNKKSITESDYQNNKDKARDDIIKLLAHKKEFERRLEDAQRHVFVSQGTKNEYRSLISQCNDEIKKAESNLSKLDKRREAYLREKNEEYKNKIAKLEREEGEKIQKTKTEYTVRITECDNNSQSQIREIRENYLKSFRSDTLKRLEQLQLLADNALQSYDDYDVPDEMPADSNISVNFGTMKVKFDLRSQESKKMLNDMYALAGKYIKYEKDAYYLSVPYGQSLLDGMSMMINYSTDNRNKLMNIIQLLVLYVLTYFPAKKAELTLIDPLNAGSSFTELQKIVSYGNERIIDQRIWNETSDIEVAIKKLSDFVVDINTNYGEKNLDKRLQEEPYKFLVITDFPHNFSNQALNTLQTIIRNSKNAGIGVFIFSDKAEIDKLKQNNSNVFREIVANLVNFTYDGQYYNWDINKNGVYTLEFDYLEGIRQKQETIIATIRNQIERTETKEKKLHELYQCELEDLLDSTNWFQGRDYQLEIPIGFAGSDNIVKLHFGDNTFQHMMIEGSTRSGKSSLLHTIIMGILLQYSPKMVKLQLIDFKDGVEFNSYKKYRLPAIENIVLNTKRDYALELLKNLELEFKDRSQKFKEKDVRTIDGYNKTLDMNTERMPRKVFIFDELEALFAEDDDISDQCKKIFNNLFNQGGAMGIQFILSTQDFERCPNLNFKEFQGRMALAGGKSVFVEKSDIIKNLSDSTERGYLYYNNSYGEGSHNLVRYPNTSPTEDGETKYILKKMDEYYSVSDIDNEYDDTRILTTRIESDPKFVINQFIDKDEINSLDEELDNLPLLLGLGTGDESLVLSDFSIQSGENMLVISNDEDDISNIFTTIVVSILYESSIRKHQALGKNMFVLDLFSRKKRSDKSSMMKIFNCIDDKDVEEIHNYKNTDNGAEQIVDSVLDKLRDRANIVASSSNSPIYFMVFGLQKISALRRVNESGLISKLLDLLSNGPRFNIHTIIWLDSYSRLQEIFAGVNFLQFFHHNILYKVPYSDAINMIEDVSEDIEKKDVAIYKDWNMFLKNEFRIFDKPSDDWLNRFITALKKI